MNPYQGALTQQFEGFDFTRPQDIKKSAKDSFAHHAKAAGGAPTGDKAALGAWFNEKVRPGFEGDGHKVTSVDGDKFGYGNHEGNFVVDYGRGAGAEGGALAWQAEPGDAATQQRYGGVLGGAQPGVSSKMPVAGESDFMAQLMESLQLQQPSPQDLLLQNLR